MCGRGQAEGVEIHADYGRAYIPGKTGLSVPHLGEEQYCQAAFLIYCWLVFLRIIQSSLLLGRYARVPAASVCDAGHQRSQRARRLPQPRGDRAARWRLD